VGQASSLPVKETTQTDGFIPSVFVSLGVVQFSRHKVLLDSQLAGLYGVPTNA
jgi:hypothetical protein